MGGIGQELGEVGKGEFHTLSVFIWKEEHNVSREGVTSHASCCVSPECGEPGLRTGAHGSHSATSIFGSLRCFTSNFPLLCPVPLSGGPRAQEPMTKYVPSRVWKFLAKVLGSGSRQNFPRSSSRQNRPVKL